MTKPFTRRLGPRQIHRLAAIATFSVGILISPSLKASVDTLPTPPAQAPSPELPTVVDAPESPLRLHPRPVAKTKVEPKRKPKRRTKTRSKNARECHYQSPLHKHAVLKGEHLGQIAGRYGVRRKDIIALNSELANPDRIFPGQELLVCPEIPPRELLHLLHVVEPGQTLIKIAKQHNLTIRELVGFQKGALKDPNRLRAGQTLDIWVQGEILAAFRPRKSGPGKLRNAQKLSSGSNYHLRRPRNAYGTAKTISLLSRVFAAYGQRSRGGPKLHIGDLSKKSGGKLSGHASHQTGHDVDIGLILKGSQANEPRFISGTKTNLDIRRTWLLVSELLKTDDVRYIFLDYNLQKLLYEEARRLGVSESRLDEHFQYPRGRSRHHGIVRHWPNHKNHIHVRFRN